MKMKRRTHFPRLLLLVALSLAVLLINLGVCLAETEELLWPNTLISSVIGAGGISNPTAAPGHLLRCTLAQPSPVGTTEIENQYMLDAGIWHKYGAYNVVGVDEDPGLPRATVIYQNWPNPFSHSTTIRFGLAEASLVDLSVFDVGGRRVQTLAQGPRAAGWHQLTWDARDSAGRKVAAGVYFYHLKTDSYESTKQMILWK
jgi:hypothetical protein